MSIGIVPIYSRIRYSAHLNKRLDKEITYANVPRLATSTPNPSGKVRFFQRVPMNNELPYLEKIITVTKHLYNPNYGDDRICECGHSYYRHFDSWEAMRNVGCKYCSCYKFNEKIDDESTDQTGDCNEARS